MIQATNHSLAELWITRDQRKVQFFYRSDSTGDVGVVTQIFKNEDYGLGFCKQGFALDSYQRGKSQQTPLIIDCGANIGASAVYFNLVWPASFIYSVEPQPENYRLLDRNTRHIDRKRNVRAAIGSAAGKALITDPGISDWGFRTSVANSENVKQDSISTVITIPSILEEITDKNRYPFICKLDIEGAESDLFSANFQWMDLFPLIIIELHDWMLPFQGTSRNFFNALIHYDFDFLYRGENIFLFNKKILHRFI